MIGVFDSGCGGLSVYREILKVLPQERYVFFADNAFCPYGEKTPEFIIQRCRHITDTLLSHGADIIVAACNTATSAAIQTLRAEYSVKFIGMEPAIKPAALSTHTGVIGIMATEGTLKGNKYLVIKEKYEGAVKIVEKVGRGWVELVESGQLSGPEAEEKIRASLQPLLDAGADNVVLGCTHYPFLIDLIRKVAGPRVNIIDPAPAVAKHLLEVMRSDGLIKADGPETTLLTSGSPEPLERIYRLINGSSLRVG